MQRPRRILVALAVAAAAIGLAGCAQTVSLPTAADANNPLCATVTVRLPGVVADQTRHWTDAQATGAWGNPTSVILTCGVTPPGPTTDSCITIDGVDWIVDASKAPRYLVTTYGRTPAVQVYLNNDVVSSNQVLQAFSPLVVTLPKTSQCTSPQTLPK